MLVLSRKQGEAIRIHDEIVVTVVNLGRGRVQLGIQAPAEVPVHREEVYLRSRDAELGRQGEAELRPPRTQEMTQLAQGR
jgi:carbon storage regulator